MMRYSRSWIRPGKWRSGESCIQSLVYSCSAPLAWLYSAFDTDAGSMSTQGRPPNMAVRNNQSMAFRGLKDVQQGKTWLIGEKQSASHYHGCLSALLRGLRWLCI